jgi:hypothetical protein
MSRVSRNGGRYLLRGFFATTLGAMWLVAARQPVPLSPTVFTAVFCMVVGAEMIGVSLIRERVRRSTH